MKSADGGCGYPAKAYHWSGGNTAEVDFVVQSGGGTVPMEVRAETKVKARSLAEYRKKYEPKYAVKTSMRMEINGAEVLNVPRYLVSCRKYLTKD